MLTEITTETTNSLPMWQASLPTRPLSGLTVLVVEDSRFSSEAIRLLCIRSGARVRRADCLRSAMRHLQTYRPEIVIVDMGLPDGNGADLIHDLTHADPRIPVILGLSGDPDLHDAAMQAGANGFLEKPIKNLGLFQQKVLGALPKEMRTWQLSIVPDDMIQPDISSLHEDLNHVAAKLENSADAIKLNYIGRFLAGVARIAEDPALEEAAIDMAHKIENDQDLTDEILILQSMIEARLKHNIN